MKPKVPHIKLAPGEYATSNSTVLLSTILGSCVAVCLYDPLQKVIGMNHIMISHELLQKEPSVCYPEDGKYGGCAMNLLIRDMLKKGAEFKQLRAKVFGGASLFKPYDTCTLKYCIGANNSQYAITYLKHNSIPIVTQSVGGNYGRLIQFYSTDFAVWVKRIKPQLNEKLIAKENKAWEELKMNT